MAHELTISKTGVAEMFSGSNTVPWHRLGKVVDGLLTAKEAIEAAQLDWTVEKQVITCQGTDIPDYFATVRQDNKRVLGIVKGRYTIIQNEQSFDFFDQIIGSGQAVYDTAGSLGGGKKIWIMAKLKGSLFIDSRPDDTTDRYVMLTKGHDGLNSIMVQAVSVRVVCQNTLSAALRGATHQLKIRHTASYESKLDQAQKTLKLVNGYYDDLQSVMNELDKQKVTVKQAAAFTVKLLPETKVGKVVVRHEAAREEIVRLFQAGKGNRGETRYDLLQGVTEYADHSSRVKTKNESAPGERRFASTMFGTGALLKQRALNMLTAKN